VSVDLRHSIYKRKGRTGWTLEYREDGKVVQQAHATKGDAEGAWDDIKDTRRRGAGLKTTVPTFGAYSASWRLALTPHVRPSSLVKYDWALRHLDELAPVALDAITRETVRNLIAAKTIALSRSSAATIASVLHTCLAEAVADGYIRSNPSDGGGSLRKKREARLKPKALEPAQLRAFLAAAGEWRDFFHVQWALGLRPGECMALQPGDVDFERKRVRVERTALVAGGTGPVKGGEAGWVDLASNAAGILRTRCEVVSSGKRVGISDGGGTWLFPGRFGTPLGHTTVNRVFHEIAARAGLPDHLTPHCLRHTFASIHLQRGTSVYYVSRMMRHSSIQITVAVYGSWLDPGNPEMAVAMEAEVLGGAVVSRQSVPPQPAAVYGGDHIGLSH
jgi:integrase